MSTVYLAFLTRIKEIHSLAFLQHRPYKSRGVFFGRARVNTRTRGQTLFFVSCPVFNHERENRIFVIRHSDFVVWIPLQRISESRNAARAGGGPFCRAWRLGSAGCAR